MIIISYERVSYSIIGFRIILTYYLLKHLLMIPLYPLHTWLKNMEVKIA